MHRNMQIRLSANRNEHILICIHTHTHLYTPVAWRIAFCFPDFISSRYLQQISHPPASRQQRFVKQTLVQCEFDSIVTLLPQLPVLCCCPTCVIAKPQNFELFCVRPQTNKCHRDVCVYVCVLIPAAVVLKQVRNNNNCNSNNSVFVCNSNAVATCVAHQIRLSVEHLTRALGYESTM